MKSLNLNNVQKVASFLKGKRLENFLESFHCIQKSLEAGGWLPGMSRKADKGFCGLAVSIESNERGFLAENELEKARYEVASCLQRGYGRPTYIQMKLVAADLSEKEKKKCSPELLFAYCELMAEKRRAVEFLNSLRPLPVKTEIGLSPKVTKTLKEMNLDIELPSIRMATIAYRCVPKRHMDAKKETYGQIMMGGKKSGYYSEEKIENEYCLVDYDPYVKWTKGIEHGMSRFKKGCEACGKPIPSGRFVPVEAQDNKSGKLVSFWLGCDCAKNIFGIKDEGISKGA